MFALSEPAQALAPLLEAFSHVGIVGHNLAFDIRFLAQLGFVPCSVFCTMLASRVLYAGTRVSHKLVDVLHRELAVTVNKDEQKSNWSKQLTNAQLRYAAEDVKHLRKLAEGLRSKLAAAKLTETAKLEMRALLGIAWTSPITVDGDAWSTLAENAESGGLLGLLK